MKKMNGIFISGTVAHNRSRDMRIMPAASQLIFKSLQGFTAIGSQSKPDLNVGLQKH